MLSALSMLVRQAERALSQVSMMTPPTQEDTSCRRHLGLVTTCWAR